MPPFKKMREIARDERGRIHREAVEYSVVDHCNLRCAGCDHASPHFTTRFANPEAFAADMDVLSWHMHVRVLRLLGGEPLLHPALDAFIGAARRTGIADQIMLWTNGVLLHKVRRELLESFDVIRVTLYPNVHIRVDLKKLARSLEESGRSRLEVANVTRFQHQLLNDPIHDPSLVQRTFLRCKDAHSRSCHTVYDGRYYKCAKAPLLEPRLAGCGIKISNRVDDGVALHGNPCLSEDLIRYLQSSDPLTACRWCLGTDGKSFSHQQLDDAGRRKEQQTGRIKAQTLFADSTRQFARDIRDKFQALQPSFSEDTRDH
jgi:organic radical activating enzyme